MDWETYRAERDRLEAAHKATMAEMRRLKADIAARLGIAPDGPMGLTPDSIKFDPAYQLAWSAERMAFEAYRKFNGRHADRFRREALREIHERRLAKLRLQTASYGVNAIPV